MPGVATKTEQHSPKPLDSIQHRTEFVAPPSECEESRTLANWRLDGDEQPVWVMEEDGDDVRDSEAESEDASYADYSMSNPFSEAQETPRHEVKVITMTMADTDDRFGYSVMGGTDEGFPARIDEVTAGSPADRAELEVGDEIVEVNGHSLSGCSHAEIISHIHQCIKSRTIQLRVKRSGGGDVVPGINEIEDAYVIAVEDQAKERLEKLSLLHKVRPVDITKVKDAGNNNHKCEVHSSLESNAIENSIENAATDSINSPTCGTADDCISASASLAHLANEDGAELRRSKSSLAENMETSVINGYMDNLNNPLAANAKYANSSSSMDNVYEPVELSADDSDMNEAPGPHREMAIDCPPSFMAARKVPPRFPMTQHSSGHSSPRSLPGTPSRKVDSFSGIRTVPDASLQQPPQMTPEEKIEHMERIKKYQEDLRKRKEEEARIQQEQDFLRTSLRGSKKLQALEEIRQAQAANNTPPTGFVNPIYQEDEDAVRAAQAVETETASRAATLPVRPTSAARKPLGVENLFSSVQHIQNRLQSATDQKDVAFLVQLFHNKRFQQALHIHNKVVEVTLRTPPPAPICEDSQSMHREVLQSLPPQSADPRVEELRRLLQKPHIKGLLYAHDKIGARNSEAVKTVTDDDEREFLYERASQYGEESIKIVRLQKTADPLGATVRNEGDSVMIGRIVKGGAAEKSGLLHEGDEILEINGVDIRGKTVNEVCDIMASLTGTLTFLIVPSQEFGQAVPQDEMTHVKAHFDYDPEDDLYIPCRELGISFVKGDILHVINMEDINWWQAYREGEEDQALAGLIPSKAFQEQREALKQTIVGDKKEDEKNSKSLCQCQCRQKKKKTNKLYDASGEDLDAEEILTYEEVSLYYPQPNRKRPVVLIGPPNVGRHELRQRLMESDIERFAAAVPHTSRGRKDPEKDGKDYHFVQRHIFEQDIAEHKFVEYGEYEKSLYGTSLDAIRQVVSSGRICVLNLYPQSLRILKASDLKPYVVFISPPNMEKLKRLRLKQSAKVTDEELKDIIEKAREMEENYGHYFDLIIVNFDLDRAYEELLQEINRLEVEPQWVPSQWVT